MGYNVTYKCTNAEFNMLNNLVVLFWPFTLLLPFLPSKHTLVTYTLFFMLKVGFVLFKERFEGNDADVFHPHIQG